MRIVIPLPWYSRAVYDITMDECRGGWRRIHIHIVAGRHSAAFFGGPGVSLGLAFSVCIGTRFTRDNLAVPMFAFAKYPYVKRWYQTLWEYLR